MPSGHPVGAVLPVRQLHPSVEREVLVLALLAAAAVPSSLLRALPATCPFRLATGRPCPACGLTRSWNATSHLRLREAARLHPFGPLTFLIAGWVAFTDPGRRAADGWRHTPLPLLGILAWAAWWLYRVRRP